MSTGISAPALKDHPVRPNFTYDGVDGLTICKAYLDDLLHGRLEARLPLYRGAAEHVLRACLEHYREHAHEAVEHGLALLAYAHLTAQRAESVELAECAVEIFHECGQDRWLGTAHLATGDVLMKHSEQNADLQQKEALLHKAVCAYSKAVEVFEQHTPGRWSVPLELSHFRLARAYAAQGQHRQSQQHQKSGLFVRDSRADIRAALERLSGGFDELISS